MMDRRAFIVGSVAALAAPLAAEAQQVGNIYRIGYLAALYAPRPDRSTRVWQTFLVRLRELGYVEGHNLVLEARFAEGDVERLPRLAAELVRLKPDVIVTLGTPATLAVRRETASIPIVMVGGVNPVEAGLVASLPRPGGNVTGTLRDVGQEVLVKILELLRELAPKSSRVGVLTGTGQAQDLSIADLLRPAATRLALRLQFVAASTPQGFEEAFRAMAQERVDAAMVLPNPAVIVHQKLVVDLASRHRIPAAYWFRDLVDIGGLMSYGVEWVDVYRRTAGYVDRILKGTRPGDLPVEQPTKFELIINLTTARALGLRIMPSLLARADEVIE